MSDTAIDAAPVAGPARLNLLLALGAIASGAGFWLSIEFRPYTGSFLVKALPTIFLCAAVIVNRRSNQSWFLLAGLLFQMGGDMILDFDRSGNIVPAMGLVCLAFVLYNLTFLQDLGTLAAIPTGRRVLFGGIVLFALIVGGVIVINLRPLMIPAVLTYVLLLAGMGITSLWANYRSVAVTLGCLLYMITDAAIGVNEWVQEIPGAHFFFWPIYFAGQILIAQGFIKEKTGLWFYEKG